MVYSAQVLDNSSFLKTGKLRVRISKYYMDSMPDLSKKPEKIKEGLYYTNGINGKELCHKDSDVRVFSLIGGGNDYGMFFIPQVNSKGYVLMIGDAFESSTDFMWLGSTFDINTQGTINFPSDSMENENGVEYGTKNISVLDGALVIKLRSTTLADCTHPEKSKDDLDWKKSPIENLIVINKEKILINHSITSKKEIIGNSVITLDKDGSKIEFIDDESSGEIGITSEGEFFLGSSNLTDGTSVTINGSKKDIEMIVTDGNESTFIKQEADGVSINVDGTALGIDKESITLKSTAAVYVDSPNVRLGPEGLRVVLAPVNESITGCTTADGQTLKFSDKVFG